MPLPVSRETVLKRLLGFKDSRGPVGMFSRGKNIYKGVSPRGNFKGEAGSLLDSTKLPALARNRIFKTAPISPPSVAPVTPQPKTFADYPYDRQYEMGLGDVSRAEADVTSMQELATRRLGEDYGTASRGLEHGFQENLGKLIQRMANQGILRSGINVQEQGEMGQELAREREGLERERYRGQEDITRETTGSRAQIQREKEQLDYERLQRIKQQELEAAQREAEAKANAALLKSLQPSPTGKIPLPSSGKTTSNRKQQMSSYRQQLMKQHPNWNTAQLTAAVRKRFPLGMGGKGEYKETARKRLELN